MSKVIFMSGLVEDLPKTYSPGTIYITTDEHGIYLDVDGETRIRLGMSDADIEEKITALTGKKVDDAITALDLDNTYEKKGAKDAEIAAAQAAVDAVEAKLGEVDAEKTVAEMIAEAAYDDSALSGRVLANETAIGKLNGGKEDEGSVAKQVADAVAAIVNDAPAAYDTLKEISEWITTHEGGAATMNSSIQANAKSIEEIRTLLGTIPAEGTDAATVIDYIKETVEEAKAEAAAYADGLALEWKSFSQDAIIAQHPE